MLSSEQIEYLVVGGYAVSFHGYPRPTGDLDVWIAMDATNAARLTHALKAFGFGGAGATPDLFLTPGRVVRMGVPPVRIEVLNALSGVDFASCYARRVQVNMDGTAVSVIGRADLLTNKQAAARPKDVNDLIHLTKEPR